jgi:hypothetical protein
MITLDVGPQVDLLVRWDVFEKEQPDAYERDGGNAKPLG